MRPTGAFDRTRLAVATGSSSGPRVTSTPGATTSVTQVTPATGPANTTLPAAGARASSPTGAAMSIPRCPGPYGPARASNPRTSGPVTGIHNAGTRGDPGSTGAHEERRPATATGAATGAAAGATTPAARSAASRNRLQPRPGWAAASGYDGDMGLPGDRTRRRRSDCPDATGWGGPAGRHPRECGQPPPRADGAGQDPFISGTRSRPCSVRPRTSRLDARSGSYFSIASIRPKMP